MEQYNNILFNAKSQLQCSDLRTGDRTKRSLPTCIIGFARVIKRLYFVGGCIGIRWAKFPETINFFTRAGPQLRSNPKYACAPHHAHVGALGLSLLYTGLFLLAFRLTLPLPLQLNPAGPAEVFGGLPANKFPLLLPQGSMVKMISPYVISLA